MSYHTIYLSKYENLSLGVIKGHYGRKNIFNKRNIFLWRRVVAENQTKIAPSVYGILRAIGYSFGIGHKITPDSYMEAGGHFKSKDKLLVNSQYLTMKLNR